MLFLRMQSVELRPRMRSGRPQLQVRQVIAEVGFIASLDFG